MASKDDKSKDKEMEPPKKGSVPAPESSNDDAATVEMLKDMLKKLEKTPTFKEFFKSAGEAKDKSVKEDPKATSDEKKEDKPNGKTAPPKKGEKASDEENPTPKKAAPKSKDESSDEVPKDGEKKEKKGGFPAKENSSGDEKKEQSKDGKAPKDIDGEEEGSEKPVNDGDKKSDDTLDGKKATSKEEPEQKLSGKQVKVELEPDLKPFEDEINEIFDGDFSDLVEHHILIEEFIHEALSATQRYKRKAAMRRIKTKLQMARKRALKRRASTDVINRRARKAAISTIKRRLSGGIPSNSLSASEKSRIERMVSKRKSSVARLTRKLVKNKRAAERARLRKR